MMRVVQWNEENKEEILAAAERIIKQGGVVVGPSDTVYGMYADATNPEAIGKIFQIKKRASEKALPIFVKDISDARQFAYIDDRKARFLEKVWPGPVTAVFHHKEKLPEILTGGQNTIGIRISNHPFLSGLLARRGSPLAQTSANFSGSEPIHSLAEIPAEWRKNRKVGLFVDGGELAGEQSIAVDFTRDEPMVLRSGAMQKRELDALLEWWREYRD